MNEARLNSLLDFLAQEPTDAFTLYAIGMEWKENNPQKAAEYFEKLVQHHPDYLAAYYQYAEVAIALHDRTKIIDLFEKGIALAQLQGNFKTLSELKNAYMNWQIDED